MRLRHRARQRDIDRHKRKSRLSKSLTK
jgi:hypothetical protein